MDGSGSRLTGFRECTVPFAANARRSAVNSCVYPALEVAARAIIQLEHRLANTSLEPTAASDWRCIRTSWPRLSGEPLRRPGYGGYSMIRCGAVVVVSLASLVTIRAAGGLEFSTARGSLVVAVRCSGGVLLAADSRIATAGRFRDGIQKVYTSGNSTWFLTGEAIHVVLDLDTKKELGRVDLYAVLRRVGTSLSPNTALDMAREMAAQAAENLNQLYSRHGLRPTIPDNEVALLGVVKGASAIALARLRVEQPSGAVGVELIPVERIPRVAVLGNDRVYNAIKNERPGFEALAAHPLFQTVMYADDDPVPEEAKNFATWLIEMTSTHDAKLGSSRHVVGGRPAVLFLTNTGVKWLARP